MRKAGILLFINMFFLGILLINQHAPRVERVMMPIDSDPVAHYPVILENFDSAANPIDVKISHKPQRVVVDRTDNVETLLSFGLEDRIVYASMRRGTVSFDDMVSVYGKRLTDLRGIYERDLDRESVIAQQPDCILGWRSTFSRTRLGSTNWWKDRGVVTYISPTSNRVVHIGTIEDECQHILDIGDIFDEREKAEAIVSEIRAEVRATEKKIKNQKKQKVAVIELSGRMITNYEKGWLVGDIVTRLGGEMPIHSRSIGVEDLIFYNPDVVFMIYLQEKQRKDIDRFLRKSELQSIAAFRNQRVYLIQLDYVYAAGVKTVEGIKTVRQGLYPNVFEGKL